MLNYNELKKGTLFVLDGQPCEILDYEFLRMQQRKPVAKTKIKNLVTGKIVERNFHSSETFEEAEIERTIVKYIYSAKGQFWFHKKDNPSARFAINADIIGTPAQFLKPGAEVIAFKFGDLIIKVDIPIKVDLKVTEAPPGIKGDTAQGGNKAVTLETGAMVNVPLFVNTGDIIRVNSETGQYVERVEKGKE